MSTSRSFFSIVILSLLAINYAAHLPHHHHRLQQPVDPSINRSNLRDYAGKHEVLSTDQAIEGRDSKYGIQHHLSQAPTIVREIYHYWNDVLFSGFSVSYSPEYHALRIGLSHNPGTSPVETYGRQNGLNAYLRRSSPSPWQVLGCYSDNVGARTLSVGMPVSGGVSTESCQSACVNAGYKLAGTEYSAECYCDNQIRNNAVLEPLSDCNMACQGNTAERCGGPNRLNLYSFIGAVPVPPPGVGPGGSNVQPVTSGLPPQWKYIDCYVDSSRRIMQFQFPDDHNVTVQSCISKCQSSHFALAGLEYFYQCFCGNSLINGATVGEDSSCNTPCDGDKSQACGGPNRLSVYSSNGEPNVTALPTVKTTNLPGQWQYQYCLAEPGAKRVFPYMNEWDTNNTVGACLGRCALFGFPAAGLEFGKECWCGDVEDIAAKGGTRASESDCTMACSGDPTQLCGGPERLQLYIWAGHLNVWHEPINPGRYEFLVPGVVVPLIATVGVNNKVTFLEKTGTGFPNSTGAYELDLELVSVPNNWQAAWRELHVKTDVFCSASIILPDKAGRQINIGGWSLDSTFGVRLFTPDGAPGSPSYSDWQEDVNTLKLQRGRWYPSALTLSNGSILVVGGETGSNAPAQPNLEILPRIPGGDTVIQLDWLLRTDPYNLYPFLFVLPSKHIFVGYYNEARVLNEVTFETLSVLPNIPGSVNNFLGGRSYPLEGAAMLFPQSAPYTDPVQVMICGGSTPFAGDALDNCVHIAPEVPGDEWVLERMPSKRVMPCMVSLPDGTFIIMNGARKGTAGFGLAEDPNLSAILYDPTKPINQRFSILNPTTIARLYHSEAILLPDGRVLVSGSDPQTYNPDKTAKYPEEFRIEVYIPPYLDQGLAQPSFTIQSTDWTYGEAYTVIVTLYQGTTDNMRVSLVGAFSSTHGNTMGSRTIFPHFHCSMNACTIIAPPNAGVCPPGWFMLFVLDGPTPSHSRWVRIGGDPAQLGNWPHYPGFTLPGL